MSKTGIRESSIYVTIAIFILSAFIIGDILGYVVMEDKPEIADDLFDKLDEQDSIRVIINKKEESKKVLIQSSSKNVDEILDEKNIKTIISDERLNMHVAELTKEDLEDLSKNRGLKRIRLDEPIQTYLSSSTNQITSKATNQIQVFGENLTGKNQVICVLDTGINYGHPALGGCTLEEYELNECDKVLGGTNIIYNNNDTRDDNGHGSHVAGIIAGNSSTIRGVAPDSKLVSVKILDNEGSGFETYITTGVQWCTDNKEKYNITIISISAGGMTPFTNFCDGSRPEGAQAIINAINKNISVIVAAGNNYNYNGVNFPACISNAIPVTSTNGDISFAAHGNRGINFPSLIAAPGVSITSAHLGENNYVMTGTSMATPHVSGVVALMKQAHNLINENDLIDSDVKNLLITNGNEMYDLETSKNYPFVQALNTIIAMDTRKPEAKLNLSNNLIINKTNTTNNNILIVWNTTSTKAYETNITIFDNLNNQIINRTIKNGILNITSENLTTIGEHTVNLTTINEHGATTLNATFFYKLEPEFTLLINGLEENITGYAGQYNISINKTSSENITIKINNTNISQEDAQNISLNLGLHEIKAEHLETINYTNKTKILQIEIINPLPLITNTTPEILNLEINENETILFTQETYNPIDGNITIYWQENNDENQINVINETYLFIAENKKNATITLIAENDEGNTTKSWNITITPMPLIVINITPQENNITIEYNESKIFIMKVEDYINRTITYNWTMNNDTLSTSENYTFNATGKEKKNYTLKVNATNNKTTTTNIWTVEVMPDPYINFTTNISNKNAYTVDAISINLSNHFSYYLINEEPEYNLSNDEITYSINNNNLIITSGVEIDKNTTISMAKNNMSAISNEFNIKMTTKPITINSDSATISSPPAAPPQSLPPPKEENDIVDENNIKTTKEYEEKIIIKEIKTHELIKVEEFKGRIYNTYEIKTQEQINNSITLEFNVEKTWLNKENLTPEEIALYRYTNEWVELETIIKNETITNVIYESIVPGFSYFVIGEKQKTIQIEEPTIMQQELINETTPTEEEIKQNDTMLIIAAIVFILITIGIRTLAKERQRHEREMKQNEKRNENNNNIRH